MGSRGQIQAAPPQRTQVNGIPAAVTMTRARTESGVMDIGVVAYQWDPNTVYHFVTLTQGGAGLAPFQAMINSIRRIGPSEAAAIRPRVIQVATVRAGETVQSLANRMAYPDFRLERFLSLNGLTSVTRLAPGQKVKLVVYGARRG
jgi:predicted Zn-dependent protease